MPGTAKKYRSAFDAGLMDPSLILDFHRATFGAARMEDGEDGSEGDAASSDGDGGGERREADDRGFPADTPWRDMTAPQQAAYWRHQARKHEAAAKGRSDYDAVVAERDRLRAANLSESEKAIEDAKAAGRTEAQQATAEKLVRAEFRVAFAGRKSAAEVKTLLEPLDLNKFLASDGEVDTDKVQKYADGVAPAGNGWPDMGAGRRGRSAGASKADAGRAEAQKRFGDRKSTTA